MVWSVFSSSPYPLLTVHCVMCICCVPGHWRLEVFPLISLPIPAFHVSRQACVPSLICCVLLVFVLFSEPLKVRHQLSYDYRLISHLYTRTREHEGYSPRTGIMYQNPPTSNINKHQKKKSHPINFEDFKIIQVVEPYDTEIAESIQIHCYKPNLNGNTTSVPLNILA